MKKLLLVFAIFAIARVNAQIVNNSFENWANDTANFAGFTGVVPAATFPYSDPVGWTSINGVTGAPGLGGLFLVTQSGTAYDGTSAIQLVTDTLATITITGLGPKQLVVPGMILNGIFSENNILSAQNVLAGATVSPASVPGAGQPFTQRLANFTGWYQYAPVLDTFTHKTDSCVIWATLRNGSNIVANARFASSTSTGGTYAPFSVPFIYTSCEAPDTLAILLSSSIPTFSSILSGQTNLVPGSVLLVDDLGYDTLAASVHFVFAVNDASNATTHMPDTIDILANDCGTVSPITPTITTQPVNGTAVVANGTIIYTSNAGFAGKDSIMYTDTDPNNLTATAWVHINVNFGVGISEANEVKVNMYPVPASNELHIQFDNKGNTTAHIYDVVGNLVKVVSLTQNSSNINVTNLTNGIYGIQLVDESNTIIARGKFAVSK